MDGPASTALMPAHRMQVCVAPGLPDAPTPDEPEPWRPRQGSSRTRCANARRGWCWSTQVSTRRVGRRWGRTIATIQSEFSYSVCAPMPESASGLQHALRSQWSGPSRTRRASPSSPAAGLLSARSPMPDGARGWLATTKEATTQPSASSSRPTPCCSSAGWPKNYEMGFHGAGAFCNHRQAPEHLDIGWLRITEIDHDAVRSQAISRDGQGRCNIKSSCSQRRHPCLTTDVWRS